MRAIIRIVSKKRNKTLIFDNDIAFRTDEMSAVPLPPPKCTMFVLGVDNIEITPKGHKPTIEKLRLNEGWRNCSEDWPGKNENVGVKV